MAMRPTILAKTEMFYYEIGDAWDLELALRDAELGNELLDATATLEIQQPGGGSLLGPVAMTVTNALLSYTVPANLILTTSRGCRAMVVVTTPDTKVWRLRHLFDCVRFSPIIPSVKEDVARFCPHFLDMAPAEDIQNEDMIREAWRDVLRFIQSLAKYPDLWLSTDDMRAGHIYRSLDLIFRRNSTGRETASFIQADNWHEEWENWKKTVKPRYDANETGTLEPDEEFSNSGVVPFGRMERT